MIGRQRLSGAGSRSGGNRGAGPSKIPVKLPYSARMFCTGSRGPRRGSRAKPLASSKRTTRWRCGRIGSSSSSMPASSTPAHKRPADHLRNVVVADRHGVGVTEHALCGLGRGPYPDSRQRCQRLRRPSRGQRHQPLQRRRPLRATHHRASPPRVDIGAMKLPGRDVTPHLGRRRHPHAGWRDRGPAFRTWTPTAATTETRRAGYPLLDDRRDQGFQHLAGAAQAQVRQPAVRGGHGRMQRHEIAGVVGAPSMAGAMSTNSSAPLPHATQRAASRPARLIRAVTGPVGSKLVRQIVPSPGTRKHGSC